MSIDQITIIVLIAAFVGMCFVAFLQQRAAQKWRFAANQWEKAAKLWREKAES